MNLYGYATNAPIYISDILGLYDNVPNCPKNIYVQYTGHLYSEKELEEIDRKNFSRWLSISNKENIDDIALNDDYQTAYAKFPYGVINYEFSRNTFNALTNDYRELREEINSKRKKESGGKGKHGYYGVVIVGTLEVQFGNSNLNFKFDIQSGGRADNYNGASTFTTAAEPGKGKLLNKLNRGKIAGFRIMSDGGLEWGDWGNDRSYIMVHLAPHTGIATERQTGSHGCISTQNEEAWQRFKKHVLCCKKPIDIEIANQREGFPWRLQP